MVKIYSNTKPTPSGVFCCNSFVFVSCPKYVRVVFDLVPLICSALLHIKLCFASISLGKITLTSLISIWYLTHWRAMNAAPVGKQRRLRQTGAIAQTCLSTHCFHAQNMVVIRGATSNFGTNAHPYHMALKFVEIAVFSQGSGFE